MSGICVPPEYQSEVEMPFCGEYVSYSACVPPRNPLWPSWNVTAKDALVEKYFNDIVADRLNREQLSLANNGSSDEYLTIRFSGNSNCIENFKKIVCLYNFPTCNKESTFPICSEQCTEYFQSCKFDASTVGTMCQAGQSVWPLSSSDAGNATVWILNGSNFSITKPLNLTSFSLQLQSQNIPGSTCKSSNVLTIGIFALLILF
jgi:hypothetical protein